MPYKNFITEVLSAHAEQARRRSQARQDYLQLFPQHKDLPILLSLADQVKQALAPVAPESSFTHQLHQELLAAAQQRRAELERPSAGISLPLIVSALVGGILVLASILFFVRNQMQQKTQSRSAMSS